MNCHEQMSQFLSFSTNNLLFILCWEGVWGWMRIYVEHVRTLYPLAFIFFWLAAVPLLRSIFCFRMLDVRSYIHRTEKGKKKRNVLLLLVGSHMFSGYIFSWRIQMHMSFFLVLRFVFFFLLLLFVPPHHPGLHAVLTLNRFLLLLLWFSFFLSLLSLTVKSETRGCPSFEIFSSASFIVCDSLLIVHTAHKRRKVIAADVPSMYDEEWNEKKTDSLLAPYFWDNNNNW